MTSSAPLHGWILYSGPPVPELVRAGQEALAAGVQLDAVDPGDVTLLLSPSAPPRVFRRGVESALPHFAIAAFVNDPSEENLALLQQLEIQGVWCVNRADTLRITRDKWQTLQRLAAAGIPVPKTIRIRPDTSPEFLRQQLGLPMVVKINNGSNGYGVSLIHSPAELDTLLEMLHAARSTVGLLAQEFIADSRGRDLRVFLIDGQPVAAMLRHNHAPGAFKSNLSAGGSASAWPLDDALRDLSTRVAHLLGLNLGGIDLLFRGDGFVVGEANSIPGFQGIESCSGLNVPAAILLGISRQLRIRTPARSPAPTERVPSLEELGALPDHDLFQWFRDACVSPASVQTHVLLDILHRNADTEFGRAHGFDSIRSPDDYRRRVPIADGSAFAAASQRMENGEENLLFAGRAAQFVATSGTTGQIKLLPESPAGILAKAMAVRLRIAVLARLVPEILDSGAFIPLANVARQQQTAAGIPIGYASGLSLAGAPPHMLRRLAHPPEILEIGDPETLNYLTLRFALLQPLVRLLIGNNPARMTALFELADLRRDSLIDEIRLGSLAPDLELPPGLRPRLESQLAPDPSRAETLLRMASARGRLDPRDYWPQLRLVSCWLGGTFGRYLEGLKPWLPDDVQFLDCGYGASEGKFNIPLQTDSPAGPLHLPGLFFEFLPADGGAPLLAHELSDGAEYGLVLTTYSGLYRYDLHDLVRVEGFTDRTPNIRFVTKSGEIADLASEKLSGAFIADVVRPSLAEHQLAWTHFAMVADPADRRYVFCIEPAGPRAPGSAWLDAIDRALAARSEAYRIMRGQRMILPPRLLVMKAGWMQHLVSARLAQGAQSTQIKLPVILPALPDPDWIDHAANPSLS